jgi:prepilin-type N-terminal cleavage/methylation domain-containing protein
MTQADDARLESGFTLIELLVAIALLGFLTTFLLAAFRLGTRHIERQAAGIERSTQIPAVQAFLRTQIANAQPIADPSSETKNIFFDGRPDGFDFVGVAPESAVTGGLQVFTVEQDRRVKRQLRVRWQLFDVPTFDGPGDVSDAVLLDGISSMSVEYYGATQPDAPAVWHSSWQLMDHLPLLIRLDVVFQNGARMPELVVATQVSSTPRVR